MHIVPSSAQPANCASTHRTYLPTHSPQKRAATRHSPSLQCNTPQHCPKTPWVRLRHPIPAHPAPGALSKKTSAHIRVVAQAVKVAHTLSRQDWARAGDTIVGAAHARAGKRIVSEGGAGAGAASLRLSVGSSKLSSSWDDRKFGTSGGMGMDRVRSMDRMSGHSQGEQGEFEGEYDEMEMEMERVLEGQGSEDEVYGGVGGGVGGRRGRARRGYDDEDSDSSLDHRALPRVYAMGFFLTRHLMVRHELLSPHSKLLPGASHATTPMVPDGRPGSIMSVASNGSMMTKSGIMKDERDTPMRRRRRIRTLAPDPPASIGLVAWAQPYLLFTALLAPPIGRRWQRQVPPPAFTVLQLRRTKQQRHT
ncbi:hypothetical protein JR316_0007592 [Psilocybe cubensis]|uniref:Uncharacterized protein n=2 Tax=Psilocybe cubensis TaxID=181762 RepID=A0A8H8CHU5_PSICU|nr:hypothetical protein JR316_0007592 [Psilocybe cubensis]KAH9479018.1 hypothetical protein JR316_0007592 [Psilocybe cubensis]